MLRPHALSRQCPRGVSKTDGIFLRAGAYSEELRAFVGRRFLRWSRNFTRTDGPKNYHIDFARILTPSLNMTFGKELKKQREAANLSEDDAANKLRLSLRDYREREWDLAHLNFPEKCGLLVGLGLDVDAAAKVVSESRNQMSDIYAQVELEPLVTETNTTFVIIDTETGSPDCQILKSTIKTPLHILQWIDHLARKDWVRRDHITRFITLAMEHLDMPLHPGDAR